MVGKFVGQRPAQTIGHPVRADQIDAGHFGFFAAIFGKPRRRQGLAGGNGGKAVALVEPFGLHADRAGSGTPALKTHLEHAHGIGQRGLAGQLCVHGIARRRRTQMGEPGARDMQMRRIRMGDRRQNTARFKQGGQIDDLAQSVVGDNGGQGAALSDRLVCKRIG